MSDPPLKKQKSEQQEHQLHDEDDDSEQKQGVAATTTTTATINAFEEAFSELRNDLLKKEQDTSILDSNKGAFFTQIRNLGLSNPGVDVLKPMLRLMHTNSMLEHKKSMLEHKKSMLEHKKSMLENKNSLLERTSVGTLLALDNSNDFRFESRYFNGSSNMRPDRVETQIVPRTFSLDLVKPDMADTVEIMPSILLREVLQHGCRDIWTIWEDAVDDAVRIVNNILAARYCSSKSGDVVKRKLHAHREPSLFATEQYDHIDVCDRESRQTVLVVVLKAPSPKLLGSKHVAGTLFDYLCSNAAFGHPNPFAVLTTLEKTWIAWMDVGKSSEIAAERDRLSALDQLLPSISAKSTTSDEKDSPSSPKLRGDTINDQGVVQVPEVGAADQSAATHCPQQRSSSNKSCSSIIERKVMLSKQSYETHRLVHILCNAMFCGLQNVTGHKEEMLRLDGSKFHGIVVTLTKNSYQFRTIATDLTGPYRNGTTEVFNVFELAGVGATSSALRAFTDDGRQCVIKMYVYACQTDARESVKREVEIFQKIYPELKEFVSTKELNGFQCVILPYFAPIPKNQRATTIKLIRNTLKERFRGKDKNGKKYEYRFDDSDIGWRHVGTFDGKVYLFDLADCSEEDGPSSEFDKYVDDHCKILQERAEAGE